MEIAHIENKSVRFLFFFRHSMGAWGQACIIALMDFRILRANAFEDRTR